MDELTTYSENLKHYIEQQDTISKSFRQVSAALKEKSYQTKLDYGMEYGCEALSQIIDPYLSLEKKLSFVTDTLSEYLTGLLSERVQAEMAVILSKKISSVIHNFMWWGIGTEDDCACVTYWIELLDEIATLPPSVPCHPRTGNNKFTDLWEVINQCRSLSSQFDHTPVAPKDLNTLLSFPARYPETQHIHGFDALVNTTTSLSKKTKKIPRDVSAYQDVIAASKIISGRAHVIICRSGLEPQEKARIWLASLDHRPRLFAPKQRKTPYEILLYNLNEWEKKEIDDFDSVLDNLFRFLITEENFSNNKQPLVTAITRIYQTWFPNGEPPWYPDQREEPYFTNPDIIKCAQFLFVLAKLGIGCLAGRWEEESLQYLLKNQSQKGYWSSSTFALRPDNYATVVAMYTLALWKPDGWKNAVQRASKWLWTQQRADGSWSFHGHISNFHVYVDALKLTKLENKSDLKLSDNPIQATVATHRQEVPKPIEPESDTDNRKERPFSFPDGQVYCFGRDLRIPTGRPQELLKKIVQNYPTAATYSFLENSDTAMHTATDQLRKDISIINKRFREEETPFIIKSIKNTGYIMRNRDA